MSLAVRDETAGTVSQIAAREDVPAVHLNEMSGLQGSEEDDGSFFDLPGGEPEAPTKGDWENMIEIPFFRSEYICSLRTLILSTFPVSSHSGWFSGGFLDRRTVRSLY